MMAGCCLNVMRSIKLISHLLEIIIIDWCNDAYWGFMAYVHNITDCRIVKMHFFGINANKSERI